MLFKSTLSGTVSILHEFDSADGSAPYAPLLEAHDGVLYGTTSAGGGDADSGTVFKVGVRRSCHHRAYVRRPGRSHTGCGPVSGERWRAIRNDDPRRPGKRRSRFSDRAVIRAAACPKIFPPATLIRRAPGSARRASPRCESAAPRNRDLFCAGSTKKLVMVAVNIPMKPIPTIMSMTAMRRPSVVTGETSPYPTVVAVTIRPPEGIANGVDVGVLPLSTA